MTVKYYNETAEAGIDRVVRECDRQIKWLKAAGPGTYNDESIVKTLRRIKWLATGKDEDRPDK